jgi:hypothetical protein
MDYEANEMLAVEMDSVVGWYVKVLLLNIFKVPDPLMEFLEKSDDSEAMAVVDLLQFLLVAGLAEEKLNPLRNVHQYMASKKLLRQSDWLVEGREPDKRTDQYMWRLTRNALRFLQRQTQ